MTPGKSSGNRLYLDTRYWTPAKCGYCEGEYPLTPLAQWLRENGVTRKKAETLLRLHYLLAEYHSKIAPRSQYFVMENPQKPITEDVLKRRQYRKGGNRNKRGERGRFPSEMKYLEKKLIVPKIEDIEIHENDNWFEVDLSGLD